jgi:putative phosphoesterase
MRYLLLSDIHSNDEALTAVLARARSRRFDRVVILGDFVGYGAEPNAVLDRLRRIRKEKIVIRGNHDKVVCGLDDGELFNPVALQAARWTEKALTPKNREFLERLPLGPRAVDGAFAICHGSPRDEDAYIFSDRDALVNFRDFDSRVCFFGHSHIPSIFTLEPHGIRVEVVYGSHACKLERAPVPINPGLSASRATATRLPRARSRCGKRKVFELVPYDSEKTRQKIQRAGLPSLLGDRLLVGA